MQDLASKFKIALSRIVVWSLRPGRSAYSLPNLHPVCDLIGCGILCKHEGCLYRLLVECSLIVEGSILAASSTGDELGSLLV